MLRAHGYGPPAPLRVPSCRPMLPSTPCGRPSDRGQETHVRAGARLVIPVRRVRYCACVSGTAEDLAAVLAARDPEGEGANGAP